jgi:hypothetical protein
MLNSGELWVSQRTAAADEIAVYGPHVSQLRDAVSLPWCAPPSVPRLGGPIPVAAVRQPLPDAPMPSLTPPFALHASTRGPQTATALAKGECRPSMRDRHFLHSFLSMISPSAVEAGA